MSTPRELADRFHERWLRIHPFAATMYGIPGYDHLIPDDSAEGQQAWRAEAGRFLAESDAIDREGLAVADAVTLDCVAEMATQEVMLIDLAADEHTVTPMHYTGPPVFLATAARTILLDEAAAEAYLTRLRSSGTWIDQVTERLRYGAAKGRLPVAALAEQAVAWAQRLLDAPDASPALAPRPPQGWDRAQAWEAERGAAVADVLQPALARWTALVRDLLPR